MTGLLIARSVFGMLMAAHGSQKLFGWFGGPGISGTASFFEQPRVSARADCSSWLTFSRSVGAAFSSRSGLFAACRVPPR